MRHPEGRAAGGEPCVKCGNPVPANAHWKYRDRHVCSGTCNANFNRQFNRLWRNATREGQGVAWRDQTITGPPPSRPSPRTSGPRFFLTTEEPETPYEWEGYCPMPGDVVVRHGVVTTYHLVSYRPRVPEGHLFSGPLFIAIAASGHQDVWKATESGAAGTLHWGQLDPSGELQMQPGKEFDYFGQPARWEREFISDVSPDGQEYRWEAPVAVPVDAPFVSSWWSPAYKANSERKKRISSSAARHERRVRMNAEGSERFDPRDVYDRDGWVCQLCSHPVDPELRWPAELSGSLDHTKPLVAGGSHTMANTQLAHLICNIRKGARFTVSE